MSIVDSRELKCYLQTEPPKPIAAILADYNKQNRSSNEEETLCCNLAVVNGKADVCFLPQIKCFN